MPINKPQNIIGIYLYINLARSANLPTGLYILPSVISSFFPFLTGDQLSQDSYLPGLIFTICYTK